MTRTPLNRSMLIEIIEAGTSPIWIFFWSHQGAPLPQPGPACLSQWYPAPFDVDGQRYPSTEHYMMAEKARVFGDDTTRSRILEAAQPAEAKRLGREVAGFESARWTQVREEIVYRGNLAKFQDPVLGSYLRSTGDALFVEASPEDELWGIGVEETDPRARDPRRWPGQNLLGFLLMRVRDRLQGDVESEPGSVE